MSLLLVLEEIDPETDCIENSFEIEIENISEIEKLMHISFEEDFDVYYEYNIDDLAVIALKKHFNIQKTSRNLPGRIRKRNKFDSLPYLIHDGRELSLMIAGQKPLSYFAFFEEDRRQKTHIEQIFSTYVKNNTVHHHEYVTYVKSHDFSVPRGVIYTIYTLPDEDWRARALIMLKESALKSGWSEGMERMEGLLLGYRDWENDAFLKLLSAPLE